MADAKIRAEVAHSRGPGEILAVAKKHGYEISDSELEPLHLKLNDLQESDASELYGALLALRRPRLIESGDGALFACDVDFAEDATDFRGELFACICIDVEDCDLRTGRTQSLCTRATQT